ncbi:hypothetical protein AA464_28405, partial [Salmonella enterica subsp. enterica serovar Newport]|nr:hypothetical protein [Salmonella enterica subsp. enterica serovar Newport]
MKSILFILMLIGGLLSFNSYAAVINQCSASAPPVTGSFNFFVVNGFMTTTIDGCEYYAPHLPPPLSLPHPNVDGTYTITYFDETDWYPTGKPGTPLQDNFSEGGSSGNNGMPQTEVDKINEQTQRYCSQIKKCDSDGEPVDINDFMEFKKKDDAAHNKPSDKPGDNPSDKPGSGSSDGADSGMGTTGGTSDGLPDGSSSGSSTPQPFEPEKPYPADAGAFQLLDSFYSCSSQAYGLPSGT